MQKNCSISCTKNPPKNLWAPQLDCSWVELSMLHLSKVVNFSKLVGLKMKANS